MNRKNIFTFLIYTVTGFTFIHGLLSFLIRVNTHLYDQIVFHYSDSFTWYALCFCVPLSGGIAFYFFMRAKPIAKGFKILFACVCIVQLTFTLLAAILNYNHFGYPFKIPTVFKEVSEAKKIITCSHIDNYNTKHSLRISKELNQWQIKPDRENIYDNKIGRPFMIFEDNSYSNTENLHDAAKIYADSQLKISPMILLDIEKQIRESSIRDKRMDLFDGIITEFITDKGIKYLFAGLNGLWVSTNHYVFYELLFIEKDGKYKLVKGQRFYSDINGIERLEYAYIAPFFSLFLSGLWLALAFIIWVYLKY